MKRVWRELTSEIANCQRCPSIVRSRNIAVRGIGSPKAKILIVGLAPGKDGADLTGIPFTRDPSGILITEMLSEAGLSREQDVFITNLVKCNPKGVSGHNRPPSKREIANCFPYLKREIEYVKPRIIVPLGRAATELLLNEKVRNMSQYHGKTISKKETMLFPFIHPGYVVRGAYDKKKYLKEFRILGDLFLDIIKQESQLSRLDILLMVLKNANFGRGQKGTIRGKTRLQKLLFLVQHELKTKGFKGKYSFRPYLYGPYSRQIYTDIKWLKMNKLVETNKDFDEITGLTIEFNITDEGKMKIDNKMESHIYKNVNDIVKNVIERYNDMRTTELVEYTHKQFKNYSITEMEKEKKHIETKLDTFIDKNPYRRKKHET